MDSSRPDALPTASAETGPGTADPGAARPADAELRAVGRAHLRASCKTSERFFREEADAVARTCWAMAKRFHRAGRLLVLGSGGSTSDAYHVSVEFVHPVLVGKRALPALVVEGDPDVRLPVIARAEDIALGIDHHRGNARIAAGLRTAADLGLLTIHLVGGRQQGTGRRKEEEMDAPDEPADARTERPHPRGRATDVEVDHRLVVPSDDASVAQEVQETLYHILWELVHVFFQHRELL